MFYHHIVICCTFAIAVTARGLKEVNLFTYVFLTSGGQLVEPPCDIERSL